jgi:hypothetical protein
LWNKIEKKLGFWVPKVKMGVFAIIHEFCVCDIEFNGADKVHISEDIKNKICEKYDFGDFPFDLNEEDENKLLFNNSYTNITIHYDLIEKAAMMILELSKIYNIKFRGWLNYTYPEHCTGIIYIIKDGAKKYEFGFGWPDNGKEVNKLATKKIITL